MLGLPIAGAEHYVFGIACGVVSRCLAHREIDLADRTADRRRQAKADDGFARETFTQPREQARQTARAFLDRWPAAAYMSADESWRKLPGGENRVHDEAAQECGLTEDQPNKNPLGLSSVQAILSLLSPIQLITAR